jgi:hypothetical protein
MAHIRYYSFKDQSNQKDRIAVLTATLPALAPSPRTLGTAVKAGLLHLNTL